MSSGNHFSHFRPRPRTDPDFKKWSRAYIRTYDTTSSDYFDSIRGDFFYPRAREDGETERAAVRSVEKTIRRFWVVLIWVWVGFFTRPKTGRRGGGGRRWNLYDKTKWDLLLRSRSVLGLDLKWVPKKGFSTQFEWSKCLVVMVRWS